MGCVFCNECDPHPFAPDPLQIFHHYYEWVRPCFPIRAGNRFSRSLRWSGPGSCCLNTGCRAVSKQVSSALIRGRLYGPILTSSKISMLHRTVYFRSASRTPRDSRSLPFPESLTTTFLRMKQHRVVWSVFLQTLTGGPTSTHLRAWITYAAIFILPLSVLLRDTHIQFFRPTATPRKAFSALLLSISTQPLLQYTFSASHCFSRYANAFAVSE